MLLYRSWYSSFLPPFTPHLSREQWPLLAWLAIRKLYMAGDGSSKSFTLPLYFVFRKSHSHHTKAEAKTNILFHICHYICCNFLKKNLEEISLFCGATDTPVLDFWWRLLWVSKSEWAALISLGLLFLSFIFFISSLIFFLWSCFRSVWEP